MIATTIKWYKPSERMPKKGTPQVLIIASGGGYISNVDYSSKYKLFNVSVNDGFQYAIDAEYWAYIPKEIKE